MGCLKEFGYKKTWVNLDALHYVPNYDHDRLQIV